MTSVPLRLIRLIRVEGESIHFMDNMNPSRTECLPVGPACSVAQPKPYQLYKAMVLDGRVVSLEPTRQGT